MSMTIAEMRRERARLLAEIERAQLTPEEYRARKRAAGRKGGLAKAEARRERERADPPQK